MFNDQRDFIQKPTVFYVSKQRKDGKYLVKFCFYAKQVGKLCTPEQLALFRLDSQYIERRK
jgi:hypothetical protein